MRHIPVIIYFIQNVPGAVCETHSKVIPERQLSSVLPEDPGPNICFRGNQSEPHGECEKEINRPRVSLFLAEPVGRHSSTEVQKHSPDSPRSPKWWSSEKEAIKIMQTKAQG